MIASPCTGVCTIDPATGFCAGCKRTLVEIAAWAELSDAAKLRIWRLLPPRRAASGEASAQRDTPAANTGGEQ